MAKSILFVLSTFSMVACHPHDITNSSMNFVYAPIAIAGKAVASTLTSVRGEHCTYFFVGLNPPTVMTSLHCMLNRTLPLIDNVTGEIVFPAQTVTREISPGSVGSFAYLDLGLYVFPKGTDFGVDPRDVFSVEPVPLKEKSSINVCGFGANNYSNGWPTGGMIMRCGSALLVVKNMMRLYPLYKPEAIKVETKKISESAISEEIKVRHIHTLIQTDVNRYGGLAYYAIGRFVEDAFQADPIQGFDNLGSNILMNHGDSGGPWFVARAGENPRIFAVTSGGRTWSDADDEIVSGYGWRIDHPETIDLLLKAKKLGADIMGLDKLTGKRR